MRELMNLLEGLLLEGGNIWKDDLATIRIKQNDVLPTVQFLEKITGLNLTKNLLGSTGLKDTSGDLDIGIDATKYNKNDLQSKLNAWAQKNDSKSLTAKSGVSVHFRTPINGNPKNGYVQTDFMFLDDLPFSKWSMSAPPSYFKGAHKHILLASVAKAQGLKWSFQKGLMDRNTGETLPNGKDPNYVAKTLFGKNATADTISTVEKMLKALENDPNREQKIQDFRNQVPELSEYENSNLKEDTEQSTETKQLSKQELERKLRDNGFSDLKVSGNKITVLTQIPDGEKKLEFRIALLQEILENLKVTLSDYNPQYSNDASLKSSIGGIVFAGSPLQIVVKDSGKQGDKSAGVANEIELGSLIQSVIEKYQTANVAFTDPRGVKLTIENANEVEVAGRTTAGRRKADVIIKSPNSKLPISIKKVNADMWESADNLFGQRAREVVQKLVDEGVVELIKIKEFKGTPVYKLSKEIVMEPTEQEALQAIFGSDINPEGGIVIQTFKPEHFKQDGNNIDVDAHAVIINKDDIPESHVMYWILRNDETRNSKSLGIPGIRPLGVTAKRAFGSKGTKDVVVVDSEGNVIKSSIATSKKEKEEKPDWVDKMKKPNLNVGREKRNI
jgi:hypothetical protein